MPPVASIIKPGLDHRPGVRRHRVVGGKQAGVEVIDLHNGRMSIRVCPTRGMGVLFARCGDLRAKGCLMGIELVKDRVTKEPFDKAGTLVYQKAFRKGLAWIPAGHILRMSPPIVMDEATLLKGLDLIDEAIGETAKELGHA